ncbi:MAG: GNAT family N-acetyltransferase [Pseudomonadota bacterium]
MEIRPATLDESLQLAELAQIAGDNIPGFFWKDSQKPGQTLNQAGAELLSSENANFSYRNMQTVWVDNRLAAMMLSYRLPAAEDNDENPDDFPEFVRPMVILEQCVPESFYINMLAAFPEFRGRGAGTALLEASTQLAINAGCNQVTLEVFDNNDGAIKLYQRNGFEIIDQQPMIASEFHPAGSVLLMSRPAAV